MMGLAMICMCRAYVDVYGHANVIGDWTPVSRFDVECGGYPASERYYQIIDGLTRGAQTVSGDADGSR